MQLGIYWCVVFTVSSIFTDGMIKESIKQFTIKLLFSCEYIKKRKWVFDFIKPNMIWIDRLGFKIYIVFYITTHIITDNVILMVLIIDFAQYMQEKKNCISYHGKHKCNYKMFRKTVNVWIHKTMDKSDQFKSYWAW